MEGACPVPAPDAPLVHALLSSTDCRVESLVRDGYGALFLPGGPFTSVLTALLTAYVALIGYRLLLGRGAFSVGEFALTAVKIGGVLALATQWETYQAVVYQFLFRGPQQLGEVILSNLGAHGAAYTGNLFDGLQRAFDDLTAFSPATPPGAAATVGGVVANAVAPGAAPAATPQVSTLLSGAGFDALLLLGSAVILLISSLGLLVAAKIVLGFLLAVGPVFIALFLFESTRGLFVGWLRASLGFALVPLSVLVMLGLSLSLLEPSLQAIEAMHEQHTYTPGVAFGVAVLVVVFALVAGGVTLAVGIVAGGLRLPRGSDATPLAVGAAAPRSFELAPQPARSARVAAAAAAQERRDAAIFAPRGSVSPDLSIAGDRRANVTLGAERAAARPVVAVEARLGQGARRTAAPRAGRGGLRSGG